MRPCRSCTSLPRLATSRPCISECDLVKMSPNSFVRSFFQCLSWDDQCTAYHSFLHLLLVPPKHNFSSHRPRIGMVAAYCHGDKVGVNLLKQNARNGCLRSAYTLGLILRDCDKKESNRYLNLAISKDYLPACQELLSSQAVKDKFGDLDYQTLKQYFDPIALNRLLGRSYLQSSGVRGVSTSHCWNPCCGRWALKATQNHQRGPQLQFSSKYLPPISPNVEFTLLNLLDDDFKKEQGCGSINFPRSRRERSFRVSRMKMCSSCRRAKYCSKLCQVYDWRSGQHKMECQFL